MACSRRLKQPTPPPIVIIVTGYASLDSAIQAVRLGAYDYLTKPFSLGQIDVVLQRVPERQALEAENRRLARQVGSRGGRRAARNADRRLDAIDARLARIEELLGRILGRAAAPLTRYPDRRLPLRTTSLSGPRQHAIEGRAEFGP